MLQWLFSTLRQNCFCSLVIFVNNFECSIVRSIVKSRDRGNKTNAIKNRLPFACQQSTRDQHKLRLSLFVSDHKKDYVSDIFKKH